MPVEVERYGKVRAVYIQRIRNLGIRKHFNGSRLNFIVYLFKRQRHRRSPRGRDILVTAMKSAASVIYAEIAVLHHRRERRLFFLCKSYRSDNAEKR